MLQWQLTMATLGEEVRGGECKRVRCGPTGDGKMREEMTVGRRRAGDGEAEWLRESALQQRHLPPFISSST